METTANTGTMKVRPREQATAIVTDFLRPHITLVRDNQIRLAPRPHPTDVTAADIKHFADSYDVYGVYLQPDCKTIRYADDCTFHFFMHESSHALFRREVHDYEKHGADLLNWTKKTKNFGYPFVEIEEMCVTFINYIWLAKHDLVIDAIYYDMRTSEGASKMNLTGNFIDANCIAPLIDDTFLVDDGKIHLVLTPDWSPVSHFQKHPPFQSREDLNRTILANPLFRAYGIEYFRMAGIVDEDANIIGPLNRDLVRSNRERYKKLFKLGDQQAGELLNFICT